MKALEMIAKLAPITLVALFLAGCGSDNGGGEGGGSGGAATGGTTSTGGTGGMGGTSTDGATSLLAPVIEMVMPMAPAGLHVTWTNQQTDCDSVEGERKNPTADWAMVFSVPGYVDNKHDGTATDPVEYTYRLRCKKGSDYSPYSNEMGGTPP